MNFKNVLILLVLAFIPVSMIGETIPNKTDKNATDYFANFLNKEYIQEEEYKDLLIKYDLSPIFQYGDQVIGSIGNEGKGRTIQIHFSEITLNPIQPDQYIVFGKSKVGKNICDFQGTITVLAARKYKVCNSTEDECFVLITDCEFKENSKQKYSGVFKGFLETDFYIDKENLVHLDDVNIVADGWDNNQFSGTWTSYDGKLIKDCSWGNSDRWWWPGGPITGEPEVLKRWW